MRIARLDAPEPDRSYAVVKADWSAVPFDVVEAEESILVRAARICVSIRRSDGAVTVSPAEGEPILSDATVSWADDGFRLAWAQPAERRVHGCGEQAGEMERRGHRMEFWNYDHYEYDVDVGPMYQSIPFCLNMDGGCATGLFLDNTFRQVWDLGSPGSTEALIEADGGAADMYLFASGTPAAVLSRYTELTGRMSMPPLWALGFQQSRYSYYPESQVREVANEFRARAIPCDVLYLDIHYMDGYRCFTWDTERFPGPKRMTADLRADGFRVIAIIDPGVKVSEGYHVYEQLRQTGFYIKNPDGSPFIGPVWPGDCLFPDFTNPACRAWWGDLYGRLLDDGIAAFWNDMNEPAVFDTPSKTAPLDTLFHGDGHPDTHRRYHNVYGMLMARATDEGLRRLRPGLRPFVLSRAGYAGAQRYAATWTGDNVASWEHLRISIPMVMNLGLSGQAFSGPDIGGFVGDPTPELFARWLQFGALMPFARVHSARATHDIIHAAGAAEQEPWSYGPEWEAINRASIELRYRLLPYLYTVFEEMTRTGAPVLRPLSFEYYGDPACAGVDDQFLVGRDLLAAPVVHEGQTSRDVVFPEGLWYDFDSGARFEGGRTITVDAPLEAMPLFVRGGAALPTQAVVQHTGESGREPIRWRVYPDADGRAEGALYEDDGETTAFQGGAFRRTRLTVDCRDGRAQTQVTTEGDFRSPRPDTTLEVMGDYDR